MRILRQKEEKGRAMYSTRATGGSPAPRRKAPISCEALQSQLATTIRDMCRQGGYTRISLLEYINNKLTPTAPPVASLNDNLDERSRRARGRSTPPPAAAPISSPPRRQRRSRSTAALAAAQRGKQSLLSNNRCTVLQHACLALDTIWQLHQTSGGDKLPNEEEFKMMLRTYRIVEAATICDIPNILAWYQQLLALEKADITALVNARNEYQGSLGTYTPAWDMQTMATLLHNGPVDEQQPAAGSFSAAAKTAGGSPLHSNSPHEKTGLLEKTTMKPKCCVIL